MPLARQIMDLVHLLSPFFVRVGTSLGLVHNDLGGVTADQHHAQVHGFWDADHADVDILDAPGDGDVAVFDTFDSLWHAQPPAGGGHDIEVNTVDMADRANLNFADGEGIDMAGTDDVPNDRTTITAELDFAGLALLAAADITADYLAVYDTSVTTHKKMLVGNLPWPTSGGATALGIVWAAGTTADGILKNAVSVPEPEYMTGRIYVQQPLLVTKFTVDVNTAGTYSMYVTSGPYDGNVTPQSDILYTIEAGVVAGAPGNLDFVPGAWLIFATGVYYITVRRTGGAAQNITETDAGSEQGRGCGLYWSDALWFDGTLQTANWPVMNLECTAYIGTWKAAGGAVYSDADVSDPPTDGELDAEWGSPAAVGEGFLGIVDDNGAGTTVWLVTSDGTNWHTQEFGVTGTIPRQTILTTSGVLAISDNPLRIYNHLGSTQTISEVFLAVGTAPVGADIIVDIHKDGVTIFTVQANRPEIAAGANTGTTVVIDVPAWAADSYLTAHIDQVGVAVTGADLVVHIMHS